MSTASSFRLATFQVLSLSCDYGYHIGQPHQPCKLSLHFLIEYLNWHMLEMNIWKESSQELQTHCIPHSTLFKKKSSLTLQCVLGTQVPLHWVYGVAHSPVWRTQNKTGRETKYFSLLLNMPEGSFQFLKHCVLDLQCWRESDWRISHFHHVQAPSEPLTIPGNVGSRIHFYVSYSASDKELLFNKTFRTLCLWLLEHYS